MKKLFLVSGAVILVVAGFATAAYAEHSWGGYHWARMANPFTLKLGDNVSSAWDSYLGAASTDWNASTVVQTAIVAGSTNPKNCKPVAGRVEACNSKYGNNGWLGLASIWINGLHITQGTVKFNDTYFNKPQYNTPAWRQLVACQEVAHTFGLDHQDELFNNLNLGTCMDYTNAPTGGFVGGFNYGPSNLYPNAHDFEELGLIYAHLDSTTTVGQSLQKTGAPEIDMSDPGSWGREVRRSADGRSSVFERDLGQGNKIITHILWAEPRGK